MGKTFTFTPEKDIPDLTGKVFFITGGTAGLGKQAILEFTKHNPKHIYFTGRDAQKASAVITEVNKQSPSANLTFIACDHTSLASVEAAAKEFSSKSVQLDALICNAGVMALPLGLTQDGYEIQFGINHLAHALFIKAFLPILQHTAEEKGDARIIMLSSLGYKYPPPGGIVFDKLKSTQDITIAGRWIRYGQSKLANVLYASELAKRYPAIISVSIHPGVIWTELNSTLGLFSRIWVRITTMGKEIPLHEGAYNTEWAATVEKTKIASGSFYEPVGVLGEPTAEQTDPDLRKSLWEWTEKALGSYCNTQI